MIESVNKIFHHNVELQYNILFTIINNFVAVTFQSTDCLIFIVDVLSEHSIESIHQKQAHSRVYLDKKIKIK